MLNVVLTVTMYEVVTDSTPLHCRREAEPEQDSREYFLEHGYSGYTAGYRHQPTPPASPHLTTTRTFTTAAKICREFLSTFLAGPVLDSLSESARLVAASPSLPLGPAQRYTQRHSRPIKQNCPLYVSLGLWASSAFGCVSSLMVSTIVP